MSAKTATTLFMRLHNKCRRMRLDLTLKRLYVEKKNGKLRPIGAPDYVSRCISRALQDLTYAVMADSQSPTQHGYMKKKGVHTVIMELINTFKKSDRYLHVYEFDFKSFFNTIRPIMVYEVIARKSPNLAHILGLVMAKIRYQFDKLEEENELKLIGYRKEKGFRNKKVITR